MLELADEQFVTIRDELDSYGRELPQKIAERSEGVTLDKLSVKEFLTSDPIAQALDQKIASFCGAQIVDDPHVSEGLLDNLSFFPIKTVSELGAALATNSAVIAEFAKGWFGDSKYPRLGRGICLMYLGYVLVAQSGSRRAALDYLLSRSIGGLNKEALVTKIFEIYKAAEKGNEQQQS